MTPFDRWLSNDDPYYGDDIIDCDDSQHDEYDDVVERNARTRRRSVNVLCVIVGVIAGPMMTLDMTPTPLALVAIGTAMGVITRALLWLVDDLQ